MKKTINFTSCNYRINF